MLWRIARGRSKGSWTKIMFPTRACSLSSCCFSEVRSTCTGKWAPEWLVLQLVDDGKPPLNLLLSLQETVDSWLGRPSGDLLRLTDVSNTLSPQLVIHDSFNSFFLPPGFFPPPPIVANCLLPLIDILLQSPNYGAAVTVWKRLDPWP